MNGTSMASPHVAAAAALLLGARPDLTPDQVEAALEGTAKDLGTTGKDNDYGYGRIDAAAALGSVSGSAPVVTPVAVTTSVSSRSVTYGTKTSTTFTATPWAGQDASLCVSVAGGTWSCATVRTSATGTYTLTRAATASFRARLAVAATGTNTAASATTTYTVKAVVSVSRTAKKTLTVKVTGAAGQKLTVQRYANKRWTTVKSWTATSSRTITGLVSGGAYRVVLASNAKVLGVTSKTVKA